MKDSGNSQAGKQWLKAQMRPYFGRVLFLTFLTVFSTLLSLAFAYTLQFLINSATAKNESLLWAFSAAVLGMLLLRIALQTFSGYSAERLRAKIVARLRTRIFGKILRSDYAKVQKYHSGDLLNRLTTDVQEVSAGTVGILPSVVSMVVQCVGAIVALLTIDPLFTLLYTVCGFIFGVISAAFKKQIKARQKDVLEADGASRAFMQEGVSSVMTLKAYGAEDKTQDKARDLAENYYKKRVSRVQLRALMNAVFSLLGKFGLIFAVLWCSISVLNGNTDYGSILSVILLLSQLQHPFSAFSSIIPTYYSRLTSGERLREIDCLPEETLALDEQTIEKYADMQSLCLENVTFTYGREEVFGGASATLEKGSIVCLTGASGSGKSTLFKLLLSVFTPTIGNVWLVNGAGEKQPITAQDRGLFAYVPQGEFLFSGTIYENLTFFMPTEDSQGMEERIKTALNAACADFVWDLPQGLQTPLTEGGGGLSEGEMQRLAVARAILSERPVLLLDEATSALDAETEKRLLENVRSLKDKTCIIVTHRPAALTIADKVLRVENGKIA